MNKIYEDAAKASYKNSLDLLEEANILHNKSKYARAYSLAILSIEEFAKSFLYKCRSVGLITDNEFDRDIANHKEKIFHAIHLMLIPYVMHHEKERLQQAIEHDKGEKDHSKHIYLKELARAFAGPEKDGGPANEILELLQNSHDTKLKGFYVDIQNNKIITPNEVITPDKCKRIIDFLNNFAHGFEIILDENDRHFRETVKTLDPQIYSGTMKSDFGKYKDNKSKTVKPSQQKEFP